MRFRQSKYMSWIRLQYFVQRPFQDTSEDEKNFSSLLYDTDLSLLMILYRTFPGYNKRNCTFLCLQYVSAEIVTIFTLNLQDT